jgi:hypothetical protein
MKSGSSSSALCLREFVRELSAADAGTSGHSAICSGNFAIARKINSSRRLDRDKTLMRGHDPTIATSCRREMATKTGWIPLDRGCPSMAGIISGEIP